MLFDFLQSCSGGGDPQLRGLERPLRAIEGIQRFGDDLRRKTRDHQQYLLRMVFDRRNCARVYDGVGLAMAPPP